MRGRSMLAPLPLTALLAGVPRGEAASRSLDELVLLDAAGEVVGPVVAPFPPTSALVLISDAGEVFPSR